MIFESLTLFTNYGNSLLKETLTLVSKRAREQLGDQALQGDRLAAACDCFEHGDQELGAAAAAGMPHPLGGRP